MSYVGEDIFVLELGEFMSVVSESATMRVTVFQFSQSRKRQVETDLNYLDVNVTIAATDNYIRVPLKDSLTNKQVYTQLR